MSLQGLRVVVAYLNPALRNVNLIHEFIEATGSAYQVLKNITEEMNIKLELENSGHDADSSEQAVDLDSDPNTSAEPPSKRVKQLEELSRKVSTEQDSNRQTDRLKDEIKVYEALQCLKNFLSKMDTLRFWKFRLRLIILVPCCLLSKLHASKD